MNHGKSVDERHYQRQRTKEKVEAVRGLASKFMREKQLPGRPALDKDLSDEMGTRDEEHPWSW